MRGVKRLKRTDCDPNTAAWIDQHVGESTTLFKCKRCGIYYKPSLGHNCKKDATDNNFGHKDGGAEG